MRESMIYNTNVYQLRDYVLKRMLDIVAQQKYHQDGGTVFYGDSITEQFPIQEYMKELGDVYNCGISGITSDMLLHFVDEGVIKYKPQRVVIMVGTNDLGNTVMASPRDIALNVKEMVEIIHYNLPDCQIVLVSALPCLEKYHGYKASFGIRSNDILKMILKEYQKMIPYDYVQFINAYPALCNKKGEPIENYYQDGLHITHEAYQAYANVLLSHLKK